MQIWAYRTGLNKCFKSHLSGMSEHKEKMEILQKRSFKEKKKIFLSHFSNFWYYSFLQHIPSFHSMMYKSQQSYSVCKFQTRQSTSHQKRQNAFLSTKVALITKLRQHIKPALYKWMAMNIQVTSSATYCRPEHYMAVSKHVVWSLPHFIMQVKVALALITLKGQ